MSVVIPPARILPPSLESRQWLAPVRAEQMSRFAEVAAHLAAVKATNHITHRIGYIAPNITTVVPNRPGDIKTYDPSGTATVLLEGTHEIELPHTNPYSSYCEVVLLLQAHPFTIEQDTSSPNFGKRRIPELKLQLKDSSGVIVDPTAAERAAGASYAIKLTTRNGGLDSDAGRIGNADSDGPYEYPVQRVVCAVQPHDAYAAGTLPSAIPRGLRYGTVEGTGGAVVLEISFSAVRVLQVDINECPALIV